MKLFSAFKTSSWEQRQPERRAAAVRDEHAPELIARLPQIAVSDEAPIVRCAAVQRLGDPGLLLERHRADTDAQVREAALTRLTQVMIDTAAGATPEQRREAIARLPEAVLERVAEAAPEVELRRAALSRLTRPAVLLRRAAEDPDAALRLELVARIDDVAALERLAETTRKRDKALTRAARERAQALRLASGDTQALEREATKLCDLLTAWAQDPPEQIESLLSEAEQQWHSQRGALSEATQSRVHAHFVRVRDALAMRERRASLVPPPAEPVAEVSIETPVVPPAPRADWSEFDRELDAARRASADRKLGQARPALERAQAALTQLPTPDRARRERLAQVEAKIAEFAEWERWSGNRARARLCEQLEALIAAGHHPDAVREGVREAQREWAKIEAAEPGDADRTSGLARRFRALCTRAMAPTQAYFEQRQALRETRRSAVEAVLARVSDEAIAAASPPQWIALRRELVEALRQLDELEPKARTALAKRLRAALTQIDAALAAQRESAAQTRQQHLAKLRRELTRADPAAAAALVRQRQTEWTALPRADRDAQAALEAQWQALVEPVFAQERARRDEVTQAAQQLERESRRLLDEVAALAEADAAVLAHADSRLAALTAAWRELHAKPAEPEARGRDDARGRRDQGRPPRESARRAGGPERDRERAFDAAVAKVKRAQEAMETARRAERLRALVGAAELFAAAEQDRLDPESAQTRWTELALDPADRRRLDARWKQANEARGTAAIDANALTAAQIWLIEAELDAGVESPPEAQAQRRQLQMQRLATRLQGAVADATATRECLLRWAELGPLPDDAARSARLQRVLEVWLA